MNKRTMHCAVLVCGAACAVGHDATRTLVVMNVPPYSNINSVFPSSSIDTFKEYQTETKARKSQPCTVGKLGCQLWCLCKWACKLRAEHHHRQTDDP
jgi:hypothetical protein